MGPVDDIHTDMDLEDPASDDSSMETAALLDPDHPDSLVDLGEDRCRALYPLSRRVGMVFICPSRGKCKRAGHGSARRSGDRGATGLYRVIRGPHEGYIGCNHAGGPLAGEALASALEEVRSESRKVSANLSAGKVDCRLLAGSSGSPVGLPVTVTTEAQPLVPGLEGLLAPPALLPGDVEFAGAGLGLLAPAVAPPVGPQKQTPGDLPAT